jgi:4-carboxymuconolactone decarboxylase
MNERERYEQGLEVRRAVLSAAHVERKLARTTEFDREFQDLLTRYAWGEIWQRPGLPQRSRSLLTLGLLVALNRPEEFRMHVRAAANLGVTRDEIKEVLLHCALYCGLPAANAAFDAAAEELAAADAANRGSRHE